MYMCYSTSTECICVIVLALDVWGDVCMNQWGEIIVVKLSIIYNNSQIGTNAWTAKNPSDIL